MDWINKIFKREEPIAEEVQPEEVQPEEVQPEEVQPEEVQPEEVQPEEVPRPKHDPNFDPDNEPVVLETKTERPLFDEHSANWQAVKAEIERRIDHWRKHNDKPADAEKTAETRGRIQELKALLNLPQNIRADLDRHPNT